MPFRSASGRGATRSLTAWKDGATWPRSTPFTVPRVKIERAKVMAKHTCFPVSVLICAVLLFLLAPRVALAQVTTGKIVGAVKDPSGAAVAGATVTITQTETTALSTVTTDAAGDYNATAL